MTAVILAAHGSSTSPRASELVRRQAERLADRGIADEVTAAYCRQPPSLRAALDGVRSDEVIVVPFMTSSGHFSQTVLPREMGLTGSVTRREGRTIRLTPPLGEHPGVSDIIEDLIERTITLHRLPRRHTGVVLVGHGTPRHSRSALATQRHAAILRGRSLVPEVLAVFLDEAPRIELTYELTQSPELVVVPHLIGRSAHVLTDVPRRLLLRVDEAEVDGVHDGRGSDKPPCYRCGDRRVYLTQSPYEEESVVDLVADLVDRARGPADMIAGRMD